MRYFIVVLCAVWAFAQTTTRVDYPTQVKNGPLFSDANPANATLQSLCLNAGSGTLAITKQWVALTTQTVSCAIQFAGGIIQPAAGQTVTLPENIVCPPLQQCFDQSSGGTIAFSPNAPSNLTPFNWGAKGNNVADDTASIQYCLNYSGANRASCFCPSAVYAIGKNGTELAITSGQTSLYGLQNVGNGGCFLVNYGTTAALTIGNCANTSSLIFAVNFINVVINQASGTTAQYGVQACGLSEANWAGLSVGNTSTTGYFTGANIRFYDSSEIDLLNLLINNSQYRSGTTGILFDDYKNFGNGTISVHGSNSAIFAFQNAIAVKNCIRCSFRDGLIEGNDYGIFVDNSTFAMGATNDGVYNFEFSDMEFLTNDIAGPTHNKVCQINSTGGEKLLVNNLVFRNTNWQLAGGVTDPCVLNLSSIASGSTVRLKFETNYINGAGTAVVSSTANLGFSNLWFIDNDIYDASGTGTAPAYCTGTGCTGQVYVTNPTNSAQQPLTFADPSGAIIAASPNNGSLARPAATSLVSGEINGATAGQPTQSDDGFLRVGAGGGAGTAANKTYCDFSGPDTVTAMNQTVTCFANGAQIIQWGPNATVFGVPIIASAAAVSGGAGTISYGSTVAAAAICGSLMGAAGCIVVNVAGTTRYVPYY